MLSWAYDMVNWEEIADHILDAVAEENKQDESASWFKGIDSWTKEGYSGDY